MSKNQDLVTEEVKEVFNSFMQNGFAEMVGFQVQADGTVDAEVYSNNGTVIEERFKIEIVISKV